MLQRVTIITDANYFVSLSNIISKQGEFRIVLFSYFLWDLG